MGNMETGRTATGLAATAILVLALILGSCIQRAAAGDGGLADGMYDCGGGYTYRAMGKVDIRVGQFRYRPYDEVINGFAPYSVDASGTIHWGGAFGGLDDPPARIVTSKREAWGFNVKYQGSPGGLINTMSCHAPGK
jgi:hypothetical protein